MPPKKESDYSKTKMYYIEVNGERYYGHTIQKLKYREILHRGSFERHPNRKLYKAMRECGMTADDIELVFVEDFSCTNRKEAEARERWWIENDGELNSNIPGRTLKEWCENNKKVIAEKRKIYHEKNKEIIAGKRNEYLEKNKEIIAEKRKIYNEKNKKHIAEYQKEYLEKKKEIIAEKRKIYNEKNKKHIAEYQKEWREKKKAINKELTS
jgi:hypothetical protein